MSATEALNFLKTEDTVETFGPRDVKWQRVHKRLAKEVGPTSISAAENSDRFAVRVPGRVESRAI